MKLGAYLQVFKHTGRADFTLKNFRIHYPDSPVYIISDAGEDFSALAQQFNCGYEWSPLNLGIKPNGYTKPEIMEFLDRFTRCCNYCNSEWVIYLEDDVFIRGEIPFEESKMIAGSLVGNYIPFHVAKYFENKYGARFNMDQYGAAGATIYHRQTFVENVDRMKQIINESYDEVCNFYPIFGNLDIFMSILYMTLGYGYHKNENMCEHHHTPNWRNTSHPIVHMNHDVIYNAFLEEVSNGSR